MALCMIYRSEINIAPWNEQFKKIRKGSGSLSWNKKWPFAYWKGNPDVASPIREALLQCNDTQLWGAQIMRQVESGHISMEIMSFFHFQSTQIKYSFLF